jgi:hypothetical protein
VERFFFRIVTVTWQALVCIRMAVQNSKVRILQQHSPTNRVRVSRYVQISEFRILYSDKIQMTLKTYTLTNTISFASVFFLSFVSMTSVHWPLTGNNSQYLILDIPHLTDSILDESLVFILGGCYYRETEGRNKFLQFPGITPMVIQHPKDTIQLETLFIASHPEGANDRNNCDMYRYQSHPDAIK